jgi:signal peptide peptidase SppA
VPELAEEIRSARGKKPIIAVSNASMASAAYWIGSAASELVVTPSGQVGSIGVFSIHEDHSKQLAEEGVAVTLIRAGKYKTEGNPFEPLSDEARAAVQGEVDRYYSLFTRDVAKGRRVDVEAVRNGFGQGRMVNAQDALKLGMVDRVATLDDVLSEVLAGKQPADANASVTIDAPRCENISPLDSAGAYRCELPAGHAGVHEAAQFGAWDGDPETPELAAELADIAATTPQPDDPDDLSRRRMRLRILELGGA